MQRGHVTVRCGDGPAVHFFEVAASKANVANTTFYLCLSFQVMLGRLVLLGLCGALDTLAAQAWGAGKEGRLPLLLQRTVLFLWM